VDDVFSYAVPEKRLDTIYKMVEKTGQAIISQKVVAAVLPKTSPLVARNSKLSYTIRLGSNFVIKLSLEIPTHLERVPALASEILETFLTQQPKVRFFCATV